MPRSQGPFSRGRAQSCMPAYALSRLKSAKTSEGKPVTPDPFALPGDAESVSICVRQLWGISRFKAGDRAAGVAYTPIETADLSGINRNFCLADTLARIPD